MSVQTQIDRIDGNVKKALAKIAEKGVTVASDANSDDLEALIAAIEAGGGGGVDLPNGFAMEQGVFIPSSDVEFIEIELRNKFNINGIQAAFMFALDIPSSVATYVMSVNMTTRAKKTYQVSRNISDTDSLTGYATATVSTGIFLGTNTRYVRLGKSGTIWNLLAGVSYFWVVIGELSQ